MHMLLRKTNAAITFLNEYCYQFLIKHNNVTYMMLHLKVKGFIFKTYDYTYIA